MRFLDANDFSLLTGWDRADAEELLTHFRPTIERLCERLEYLPVFRHAQRVRRSKEDTFWHIGTAQMDDAGNLEAYQYFQPHRRHFYIRNHGGAGEIQFNIGVFGDHWDIPRSVRVALGFSFGGRFIADVGSLGTVKTPWFFRGFRELMEPGSQWRSQMELAVSAHGMIYSRDRSLTNPAQMIDAMIALDEELLPSDESTWVAFEHFVTWEHDQSDLLDMDKFISNHCKPVFDDCYPVWEAVQKHTRQHFGAVI